MGDVDWYDIGFKKISYKTKLLILLNQADIQEIFWLMSGDYFDQVSKLLGEKCM